MPKFDRALALERALEEAWLGIPRYVRFFDDGSRTRNLMAAPYAQHWNIEQFKHVPALLLNTTEVSTGKRRVIAPFQFEGTSDLSFFPLYSQPSKERTAALPLSTAAILSARFPWVTPPGWIAGGALAQSSAHKTHVVDGGYFENSGVATAHDLIKTLDKELRKKNLGQKVEITLIILTSADFTPSEIWGAGEAFGPIQTMLNARQARASIEIDRAKAELDSMNSGYLRYNTVKVKLSTGSYSLPLGWRLSSLTKYLIDYQRGDRTKCESLPGQAPYPEGNPNCAKALIYQRLSY